MVTSLKESDSKCELARSGIYTGFHGNYCCHPAFSPSLFVNKTICGRENSSFQIQQITTVTLSLSNRRVYKFAWPNFVFVKFKLRRVKQHPLNAKIAPLAKIINTCTDKISPTHPGPWIFLHDKLCNEIFPELQNLRMF